MIDADPKIVAEVNVPDQFYTALINMQVIQCGNTYEVWVQFGKKHWQIADGPLETMNAKRDRILRFIQDPFAPAPTSFNEFVKMTRGL